MSVANRNRRWITLAIVTLALLCIGGWRFFQQEERKTTTTPNVGATQLMSAQTQSFSYSTRRVEYKYYDFLGDGREISEAEFLARYPELSNATREQFVIHIDGTSPAVSGPDPVVQPAIGPGNLGYSLIDKAN